MGDSEFDSILVVSQYYPPETGAGPTRMRELSSRWVDRGHDVTVVTSAPDYPEGEIYEDYENDIVHTEYIDGVRVVSLLTIPASNKGFARRAVKFVWFMFAALVAGLWVDRHDVVVATAPQPLTGPAGWVVARVKGSRFVYEVRDLWPESITALSDIAEWKLEPLRWIIEFTYRRADRLVAVSPGFESTFVDAGADAEDVLVQYNGVDPTYFEHDGEWSLEPETVETLRKEFVVAYVGTLGRAHGLSTALDAAKRLEDVTFLFVGTGSEKESIRRAAERRDIDNVRFEGRHPKHHVPDFLALSDLALVHLKDEQLFRTAIPSKMFEAMAAGVPVLMGVRGTAAEIVERGDAGIPFQPEDPGDLMRAVRDLRDDKRRARLGANAEQFVAEEFSWDQIAASYAKDLERLADS